MMNSKQLLDELRDELRGEFTERFECFELKYTTLALSYHDIIKDVHHHLGGSLARLEGLFLLELREGTKFKHKEIWDKAFAMSDIYRQKIQDKYINNVQILEIVTENKYEKENNI